jgi:putative endonuclease
MRFTQSINHKKMKTYFTYIITNKPKGVLYIGVTNNLERRMMEHKHKIIAGFSARYNLNKLVYFTDSGSVESAIAYEKKLKGWLRSRKIELIEEKNPEWLDLSLEWF